MSKIEWCDVTWNPITGCSPISEGCRNCYATRMAQRLKGRFGYPVDEPFRVTFHPDRLEQPMKWKKPRKIFVCSMGDLFHRDIDVDSNVYSSILFTISKCPQHTFIILTKRPGKMKFVLGSYLNPRFKNVWLGVTAENQAMADERIPILLQIPAVVRFVSVEPMLEPIDLRFLLDPNSMSLNIDWIIAGKETGPKARPCELDWVIDIKNQCREAGVPFFYKNNAGCLDDGVYQEYPLLFDRESI